MYYNGLSDTRAMLEQTSEHSISIEGLTAVKDSIDAPVMTRWAAR
jgi:hypothetical protein